METTPTPIASIRALTQGILNLLEHDHSGDFQRIKNGLLNSVIRALGNEDNSLSILEAGQELTSDIDRYLWQLTQDATNYMTSHPNELGLAEAVAALQHLSLEETAKEVKEERLVILNGIQEQLKTRIETAHNGPYLVTNVSALYNWLGEELPTFPQMALCRCGGSSIKPFCDGTHAVNHFTGDKDPKRVPDQRDTYVGLQVTVFDNRGICQHSGLCTDRVANVFRLNKEPFVAPSGGRMDEIIRAVRDCPSGALSYAVDGVEAREQ